MTEVTRRIFVASGAAVSASAAQSPQRRSADLRDTKAPPQRHLLESRFTADQIGKLLTPHGKWEPWPLPTNRAAWESIPADVRNLIVERGESAMKAQWAVLPATLFLEYVRNGNRSNFERAMRSRRERLEALVLAECVEAKGRFLDEIANGVWIISEESFWGYPAHMSLQREGPGLPDVTETVIDLFAAETGSLLAWVDYLLAPRLEGVHKQIVRRLRYEVDRRILTPYEQRTDFWWMGFGANRPVNNWNPWINSNCLACTLLLEPAPARRAALVHKVIRSVDRFLDAYHDDGGCDEGPSYWGRAGASLFDNLELLYLASNRQLDFFGLPLVREIGKYVPRVHIADDWYVNFADASARVALEGDLVYRYGARIQDENMQLLGAWAAQSHPKRFSSLLRELPALFNIEAIRKAPARQPFVRDAWFPGIQVMTARCKAGSQQGLYLAAQGGHNAESHNHNDVGNFIVYADGKPAIIDVGVETYTAKTFSSRRYEIWTMQSAYHNLPTVNGVMQSAGRNYEARNVTYNSSDTAVEFALDIGAAYPREAGIETWRRTLRLDRTKNEVTVRDAWVLQNPGRSLEWSLMTPYEITADDSRGRLTLGGGVQVLFPAGQLDIALEQVKVEDARLRSSWGTTLWRILIRARNASERGEVTLRILQT